MLFFGALEDFMLRLLLVCACVSIGIDLGFADPDELSHGTLYHHDRIFEFNLIKYSMD